MPKAYVVAHILVHDKDGYEKFRAMSGAAIAEYWGKVLVRNPAADHREGALRGTTIVLDFDDTATARRFYESDAYTAARKVREQVAETDLLLVEGV